MFKILLIHTYLLNYYIFRIISVINIMNLRIKVFIFFIIFNVNIKDFLIYIYNFFIFFIFNIYIFLLYQRRYYIQINLLFYILFPILFLLSIFNYFLILTCCWECCESFMSFYFYLIHSKFHIFIYKWKNHLIPIQLEGVFV